LYYNKSFLLGESTRQAKLYLLLDTMQTHNQCMHVVFFEDSIAVTKY